MKNLIEKYLIPGYAIVPLAIMIIVNIIAYFGTRTFTTKLYHYNIMTLLDQKIPLCTIFVIPYIFAYVQWILGYVMIARESREHCYYIVMAEIIAKILAGITFIVFPTTMRRADILSQDILSGLTAWIYAHDAADNLFPSIHCLESWFCFYGCIFMRSVGKKYKIGMFIMTILVFMSIVLLRQHVLYDMIGAIIYAAVGLYLSKKILALTGTSVLD